MTNDAEHDPEFEAFLRRRSPMHRRLSQIDHAEPSADLDRIVLDRARDAIRAPSQEPIYRKSRWAMPLGLAATILIAFTVVLNIDHQRAGSVGEPVSNASARLADAPAAAPRPQLMERARAESATADAQAALQAFQAAESSSLPAPPAAAPARDSGKAERRQVEEQKRVAKSAAAPGTPAPVADRAEQPELIAGAAPQERAEAESADDSFTDAAGNSEEIVSRREGTVASSRSGLVTWGHAAAAKSPAPPASAPAAADPHATPETWLREINRLRAEGKNEEADRELVAFRRAHPTHPGYSLAQPPTR